MGCKPQHSKSALAVAVRLGFNQIGCGRVSLDIPFCRVRISSSKVQDGWYKCAGRLDFHPGQFSTRHCSNMTASHCVLDFGSTCQGAKRSSRWSSTICRYMRVIYLVRIIRTLSNNQFGTKRTSQSRELDSTSRKHISQTVASRKTAVSCRTFNPPFWSTDQSKPVLLKGGTDRCPKSEESSHLGLT